MTRMRNRRQFMRDLGLSTASLPFLAGLPSLKAASNGARKQRLVIMISPNGTVPSHFWPDEEGADFSLKKILSPLEVHREKMLILHGLSNKVRGDGDSHMRGMSCLLTGKELFPGNIQGGSDTPAGWCSGISIDQELKNFFQSREDTRTRFGSLEFGVGVPDRADPWTRMVYSGPNKPVGAIDDPYQMFNKLYGKVKDKEHLGSILDDLQTDLKKLRGMVSPEDRQLLEDHADFVRELETELKAAEEQKLHHAAPELEPGISDTNDNIPAISRMQVDLMVNSFTNDMARVATLQYTNSVGQARMRWLGINEGHHGLSHEPDDNEDAQEKLVKINIWFAEQLNYLVTKLANTPEPGSDGSMLDHTTVLWTNELGKGNSHTLNNIPFVLVGGGFGFEMGRSLKYDKVAHNRLWLSLAHGAQHDLASFGNPKLCEGGALDLG
ncbi:MAG: hypothetical protein ACI8T1_001805 [Verrucomicrobiales bacterium]|jgi:hypothetical protein